MRHRGSGESPSPRDRATARVCATARSRAGSTLAPRSRLPARSTATPSPTATKIAIGTSAAGCEPVSGWSSSIQPRGLAQRNQRRPVTAVPTNRRTNATPNAPAASDAARRRVGASCAVTAPTETNTADDETSATARNNDALDAESSIAAETHEHDDRRGHTELHEQATTEPDHRLCRGSTARRLAGDEELPPSGLFLAAQETGADEEPPHRTHEHHEPEGAPRRESANRVDVACRSEQGLDAGIRAEQRLHSRPVGRGRVRRHVTRHRREDRDPEHRPPQRGLQRRAPGDEKRDHPFGMTRHHLASGPGANLRDGRHPRLRSARGTAPRAMAPGSASRAPPMQPAP